MIGGALTLRSSNWAREYRLKRASLPVLTSWAERSPRDPLIQYYLGTQYFNNGFVPEALIAFRSATALEPRMTRAFVGAAVAHRQLGQKPEAYAAAKQALLIEPESETAQYLVATLVAEVSPKNAIPEYEKLIRLTPKNPEAWYGLGSCQAAVLQNGDAVGPLTRAVELQPSNAVYRRDLGKALMELSRFEVAIPHLRQAAKLDSSDPTSAYYLGRTLSTLAKNDAELQEADRWLQTATELLRRSGIRDASGEAELHATRAGVLQRLNRLDEAERLLKHARKLSPRTAQFIRKHAEIARLRGRQQESARLMQEYSRLHEIENQVFVLGQRLKQDDKNADLRLRFARVLVQSGDIPQAYTQYGIALNLKPDQPQVRREYATVKKQFLAMQRRSAASPPQSQALQPPTP